MIHVYIRNSSHQIRIITLDVVNRVPLLALDAALAVAAVDDCEGQPMPDPQSEVAPSSRSARTEAEGSEAPGCRYLTHEPKHPKCESCQTSKMLHRQHRNRTVSDEISCDADGFGDLVTCGHPSLANEDALTIHVEGYGLVIEDSAAEW